MTRKFIALLLTCSMFVCSYNAVVAMGEAETKKKEIFVLKDNKLVSTEDPEIKKWETTRAVLKTFGRLLTGAFFCASAFSQFYKDKMLRTAGMFGTLPVILLAPWVAHSRETYNEREQKWVRETKSMSGRMRDSWERAKTAGIYTTIGALASYGAALFNRASLRNMPLQKTIPSGLMLGTLLASADAILPYYS